MKAFKAVMWSLIFLFCIPGDPVANDKDRFFKVSEIDVREDYEKYLLQDLNDDDLKDLIVLKKKQWLLYFQTSDGFPPEADQQFTPDSLMLAFDFGDVDGEPGKELVYFTREGLFFYPVAGQNITGKSSLLFKPRTVFQILGKQGGADFFHWRFVEDFNDDGNAEILVPLIRKYAIYSKGKNGTYGMMTEFDGETRTYVRPSWNKKNQIVVGRYRTRKFLFEDYNRDGRKDIISIGEKALIIFMQDPSGLFPETPSKTALLPFDTGADFDEELEEIELEEVADLNNDGFLDLVTIKVSAEESFLNPKTQVQLYMGKEDAVMPATGAVYQKKPDHVIISEGVQFDIDVVDLNGDDRLDIIVPTVELGVFKIVKMLLTRSASMDVWFYTMNADGSYAEAPDYKKDLSIKFSFSDDSESMPVLDASDFNGDGVYDLLSSKDDDELSVFYGGGTQLFSKKQDVKYKVQLPKNGENVKVEDINNDGKTDLIMRYTKHDGKDGQMKNIIRILIRG